MAELYDTDVFEWSQQQSALLRRRAAGELVNERELDWPNIAEEIEGVGSSQLKAVRSLLVQALLHDLKRRLGPRAAMSRGGARKPAGSGETLPTSTRVPCGSTSMSMLSTAAPSLRCPTRPTARPPLPVPQTCPLSLDDLLQPPSA